MCLTLNMTHTPVNVYGYLISRCESNARFLCLRFKFNSLHAGVFFMIFCRLWIFLINYFQTISFRNTISVSNSLDLDQARRFVRPDQDPNYLQRL